MNNLTQKEIFDEIVRRYYSRLLLFVRGIVGNESSAQDVVQEAFISAYKSFDGYVEQGKVFSWLKTIARNAAYRYMQKESKFAYISLSYTVEEINIYSNICSIEEEFIADESYLNILEIINKLPEHQRTVFYYRFVEGMSIGETALKLNIPQGSVKSKTYYGLNKIKTELKNYLIESEYIMECKQAYEYLYQFAKDAILPEDKEKVEKHLEVCDNCKDIAESLKKLLPQIKPAPEGIMRHYGITFKIEDEMILNYTLIETYIKEYQQMNEILQENNGEIPVTHNWFTSGFSSGINHIAEFDNEGNHIDVQITANETGHQRRKCSKMKKVFEYHQMNTVFLSKDNYKIYSKSFEASNLYIVKANNNLGTTARSGLYVALPNKAVNIRLKQGVDYIDCGAYKFVFDDRYVTESQTVVVECTYNL